MVQRASTSYLPGFVAGFSADIIGFQRGFGHPMRIGYANSARFWEPCFWGINDARRARCSLAAPDSRRTAEQRLDHARLAATR
ncbi:hypothetical protein DPM13_09690 [Paracoccus mutanolyticus]|uniref:Uncharacterized protein n=1 Tax=Paracoccus mutanolyticus TaxID=1499308 RepID=A0ABM6WRS8_9RHOB|nr:hypothetical protein [Paracoccus mutanolyticus]AWX93284.1 hypothetical protein DPM13_09690 [Paracoccus mutanolyticus]